MNEQQPAGKILALNEEARNSLAQRREAQVSEATRAQIEAQLSPLTAQLEQLAEQVNMIPVYLRTSLQPTVDEVTSLRADLAALPEALAARIAPALDLTERLDEVLKIQRNTLDDLAHRLTEKSDERIKASLDQLRTEAAEVSKLASQSRGALQKIASLPAEVTKRQAHLSKTAAADLKEAHRLWNLTAEMTAKAAQQTEERTEKLLEKARRPDWTLWLMALVAGAVPLVILGILVWHGTVDLSGLQPSGDAARQVLEQMHRDAEGNPGLQEWIAKYYRTLDTQTPAR